MTKKKITVEEFNKEFFNDWTKIKKITPHFINWSSMSEDEEDIHSSWNEIEKIDIEFDNGEKVSIFPFSNKQEDEELCLGLKIVQYKGEEVNWRLPKK